MRTTEKSLEMARDPVRTSGPFPERNLDVLVRRFDPRARRTLRRLVYSSPRVADLIDVFPAAGYALATRRGTASQRRKAIQQVEAGAQLKEVARTLELPLWLRRLPPEAFRGELGAIPASEMFVRRISNHLPRQAEESALWLQATVFGTKACNEYFSLWLASQPIYHGPADAEQLLGTLAAYAWYSGSDGTRGKSLIVVPWRPEMALDTAVCAAKSWLNRIRLVLQLKPGTLSDPWLQPGEALGLTFQPISDHTQILAEAQAMHNCADQYAERLAREKCRLFSVRRKGQRLATLEVGPHPREAGVLTVTQLKARHNMPASNEVWQAAHAWLAAQRDLKRLPALAPPERPLDAQEWETLMMPYRLARRGAPWLPESLTPASFASLESNLCDLARRGGISSWLFT